MKDKFKEKISRREATFIACSDNEITYKNTGIGVKPIITPMRTRVDFFKGMDIYDTTIGKAAAMLLALSGAKYVYGEIMSRAALTVLASHGIEYEYKTLVDFIKNRTGDGICPLEQSVLDTDDIELGYRKIEERIAQLMAAKQPS